MKIVDLRQRTPEWHAWRRQGITATATAVILGQHVEKTRWRLWAELTGRVAPLDLSMIPQVRLGILHEPYAVAWFEERYKTTLLPLCGECATFPLLRASFDGVDDDGCPVEVKVPSDKNFDLVLEHGEKSEPYRLYWWQVQHQIAVAGSARGYLVFYSTTRQPLVFEIRRDPDTIELIKQQAQLFWDLVVSEKEPEKDPQRDYFTPVDVALARWATTAQQVRDVDALASTLQEQLKALKGQREALQADLVEQMGGYMLAEAEGVRVVRYQQAGNMRWKDLFESRKLQATEEERQRFRQAPSERVRITLDSDHPITTAALEAMRLPSVDQETESQAFCL
nr:YqaJ viral recombinase family protein [uncultured Pseudomonas sp.]